MESAELLGVQELIGNVINTVDFDWECISQRTSKCDLDGRDGVKRVNSSECHVNATHIGRCCSHHEFSVGDLCNVHERRDVSHVQ